MKEIINGKLYNTETAEAVGYYSNGYNYSDGRYYDETLYRKRTGEYFIHGTGMPLSKYSETIGSTIKGTSEIIPYSEAGAREWAERHMKADDYMEVFGEVEE